MALSNSTTVELSVRSHPSSSLQGGTEATDKSSRKRVAVFLDRDGVINNDGHYVNSADHFQLIAGAATAIRRLNDEGLPVIVVTNQGNVALGYLTRRRLEEIHDKLEHLLATEGARVDAIYAALCHPEGKIDKLAKESIYRKPAPGMIEKASEDLGINQCASYMVGDTTTDLLAGKRAGCTTLLVRTGFGGTDKNEQVKPTAIVDDLGAAVKWILTDIQSKSTQRNA